MRSIIERNGKEIDVAVNYYYYKGFRGNRVEPSEPASVEIESVIDKNNHDYAEELTEEEENRLEMEVFEYLQAEHEYYAELKYEERKERMREIC